MLHRQAVISVSSENQKTIDNDLIHTDHTPGFGSAARYVASTVREITIDANVYEKKSVTIIEIMGRHAGWLTAASALARKYTGDNPLLIYLPETAFDQEEFLKAVENSFEKKLQCHCLRIRRNP